MRNDFFEFNKSYVPIAVLLEGKFRSLYSNRISQAVLDSVQRITGKPYLASGIKAQNRSLYPMAISLPIQ
jgi:ABC-2 type transport system permease protein